MKRPHSVLHSILKFFVFVLCRQHQQQQLVAAERNLSPISTYAVRKFLVHHITTNGLLKSIPALSKQHTGDGRTSVEVSTRTKPSVPDWVEQPLSDSFFYGLSPNQIDPSRRQHQQQKQPSRSSSDENLNKRRLSMKDTLSETLSELRGMRMEMERLRLEMQAMKRGLNIQDVEEELQIDLNSPAAIEAQRKRQQEFDEIGAEVERWAEQLLFHEGGEEDGWKEVSCNRVVRSSYNPDGRTKAYLKWMKDSRGAHANPNDNRDYPCIRVYSTIDAPLDEVCMYLSQEDRLEAYNDMMMKHRVVEEIAPHAKICWGLTHQILFVKPRELVTFCHHKWLRDGTQLIVNQACNHDQASINRPQAYALRGANYIGSDPDDPGKTRICLLSHASPGPDVPQWACTTAINALAPIEPFKLFHRINSEIQKVRPELERRLDEMEHVSVSPGHSSRPAGMAQMGYCCFWPKGGGLKESGYQQAPMLMDPTTQHNNDDTLQPSFESTANEPDYFGVALGE